MLGWASRGTSKPDCVRRWLTVLAWGRNLEGQAGVEGQVLVTRPTPVMELVGVDVVELAASKLTSAAVTASGQLYTWGDGWGGKLGHGTTDAMPAPARVEALVGRVGISRVALGDQHSILCDGSGHVWACGENREGQCGLGTPPEVIAQQRGASQHSHMRRRGRPGHAARGALEAFMAAESQHPAHASTGQGRVMEEGNDDWGRRFRAALRHLDKQGAAGSLWASHQHQTSTQAAAMGPDMAAATTGAAVGAAHARRVESMRQTESTSWPRTTPLDALMWGGLDWTAQLTARGALPGQQTTPARLGRDLHPLARTSHVPEPEKALAICPNTPTGISQEQVLGVAAGRHYGLAWDAAGQVWAWGTDTSGCLGGESSWANTAQRVDGELASTLEGEGGAVAVAAGGTFAVAITGSGKAVVWGTLPHPVAASRTQQATETTTATQPTSPSDERSDVPSSDSHIPPSQPTASVRVQAAPAPALAAAATEAAAVSTSSPAQQPTALAAAAQPVSNSADSAMAVGQTQPTASPERFVLESPPAAKASASGADRASGVRKRHRSHPPEVGTRRVRAGVVPGLPPITHVAAGQQHALLSDGRRVWLLGRSHGPDGGADPITPWDEPIEVLDVGGAGVRALRAGAHSSAVVTHTGELWMWGRLMDASHAAALLRRQTESAWPHREVRVPDPAIWDWAGFGGAAPALVTGLSGQVVDVALGGWHALVLVD